MSTSFPVNVACRALFVALVASACSDAPSHDGRVSYTALDLPLSAYEVPIVRVTVLVDATGPDAAAGRAFADALTAGFADPGDDRFRSDYASPFRVHVVDDRGTEAGVRGAAALLEVDPGAHVVIVAPGRGRAAVAAELAPRTVVVCAGCESVEALREGVFALTGAADGAARAVESWLREAMSAHASWDSRVLATQLRATRPPSGYARSEGSRSASDPTSFRRPSAAITK